MTKLSVLFTSLALATAAMAVPQPLITPNLSTTLAKGTYEFENRILWSHSGGADELAFSHEVEFGVGDNFEVDPQPSHRPEKQGGIPRGNGGGSS